MMVSPKGVQSGGEGFGNKPICAGPYRLVQRIVQDRIVLEKFPEYWKRRRLSLQDHHLHRHSRLDGASRQPALGQLDLIERLAATNIPTVKGDPKLKVVPGPGSATKASSYNIANGDAAKGPFGANPKLREALDLAIDRDALNQVVFAGAFMPGNQAFPPGTPFYNQSIPMPKRDVAKAKALVKESGVANPDADHPGAERQRAAARRAGDPVDWPRRPASKSSCRRSS